ncbi:MAG: kinase/pyrophosphorylase [Rhodospirillales bacterium]|nr:kinase/pyrophosphorylase [Rhodospirillales bacterium]
MESPIRREPPIIPKSSPGYEPVVVTKEFNLHLVSDSTGETVITVARAGIAQFDDIQAKEYVWPLVRSREMVTEVLAAIEKNPGMVLFTMVNTDVRKTLEAGCCRLGIPCISILDPVFAALGLYLKAEVGHRPGRQHMLDAEYFERIAAMEYALSHDDGQATRDLESADVLLLGVSRTSKSPTCIYLANRGVRAANVPIVAGVELPPEVLAAKGPLKVGLTKDPRRLVQIRRNRLKSLEIDEDTDYIDFDKVTGEVTAARRLFAEQGWPVIDVTRRSVEETAAAIIQLLKTHRERTA